MREYELTVVYDLAVAEAGGPDASPLKLTTLIEARGGAVLNIDHWGRRRLAYPIGRALDADYVVSRINFDPTAVSALEAALGIDEAVFRHLIVRADELPVPPPPREPRRDAPIAADAAPAAAEVAPVEAPPAAAEAVAAEPVLAEAVVAEAAPAEAVAEAPAEAPVAAEPAPAVEVADAPVSEAPSSESEPASA